MTKTKSQRKRARTARRIRVQPVAARVVVPVVPRAPSKKQPPRGGSGKRMPAEMPYSIAPCTRAYIRALQDPASAEPACLPAMYNSSSLKIKRVLKGVFYTGTMGFGFIRVSPGRCTNTAYPGVAYTNSAYAGVTGTTPYTGDVGVLQGYLPSDYGAGAPDDNVNLRVVACGVYVQNRTPINNRGCLVYGMESPDHATLASPVSNTDAAVPTFTQFLSDDASKEINTDSGDWVSLTWHPVSADEANFYSVADASNVSTVSRAPGNYALGFTVQSLSGNAQTFCFEVWIHYEALGSQVGGETVSPSDPAGLSMVNTLFQHRLFREPVAGNRWSKFLSLAAFVTRNIPEIAKFVAKLRTI